MLKLISNKKGFTLIEIIVSIAILAIIITPLSSVFTGTFRMNMSTREKMVANNLAQKYMEEWKAKKIDYNDLKTQMVGGVYTKDVPDDGFTVRTQVQVFGGSDYTMPSGGKVTDFNAAIVITDSQIMLKNDAYIDEDSSNHSNFFFDRALLKDYGDYPGGTYIDDKIDNVDIKLYKSSDDYIADFSCNTLGSISPLSFNPSTKTQKLLNVKNDSQPIKIKVLVMSEDEGRTVRFNVKNTLSALSLNNPVNFYIVHTDTGDGNVSVKADEGKVSTFYNIYNNSVDANYDKNRLYKVIVKVCKGAVYNDAANILQIESLKRVE